MFRPSTFFYSLKQGLRTLFKNRRFSLAAISTMTACLFLFGLFYFVASNLQNMIKVAETSVGITVFFDDNITYDRVLEIQELIRSDARVSQVDYKSAELAWEEYKNNYLNEELAASFGEDNPLENSSSLTIFTSSVDYQEPVVGFIRNIDGVRQVNSAQTLTETLQGINKIVLYVSMALIIVLLAISMFLISITVSMGVSIHRKEISIMKMIGATDYFIRGPFVVEGIMIGIIGALIPLLLLRFAYDRLTTLAYEKLIGAFDTLRFLPVNMMFSALVPISLLIGIGVGFLGSYITMNRELRKID